MRSNKPPTRSPARRHARRAVRETATGNAACSTLEAWVERDAFRRWEENEAKARRMIGYFAAIGLVGTLIVWWLTIKIVPELQHITVDFQVPSPGPLRWFIGLSDAVSQYWWLLLAAAVAAGWLLTTHSGWRYFARVWLSRFSRVAAECRGADVMSLLAIAGQNGRPFSAVLSTLARYHYDRGIRARLLLVRNEIEQGAETWDAMAAADLMTRAESQAVAAAAPDAAARIWTLERLARLRRERAAVRVAATLNLLQPAVVLCLAAGVLLVALAVLTPLIQMIDSNLVLPSAG